MSKNPLDLLRREKFSREELAEALRLSIIAELDAINLYLQLARLVDDERYRRVFEDIAREEKTHVGEFLSLLKTLDKEQVEELVKGAEEVRELTGLEVSDPPDNGDSVEGIVRSVFLEAVDKSRVLRKYLPVKNVGEGVETITVYTEKGFQALGFTEISLDFSVEQRMLSYAIKSGDRGALINVFNKGVEFAYREDETLLKGSGEFKGLLNTENTLVKDISSWEEPGSAFKELSTAYIEAIKEGIKPPFTLFVSPKRYLNLLSIERGGVMELHRIREFIDNIAIVPVLSDDTALLIATSDYYLDMIVSVDTRLDYIGPDKNLHMFRAWETFTLRIKNPKAIILLKQK